MKSITIGKTINLGDFQSLRVDITCDKEEKVFVDSKSESNVRPESDKELIIRAVSELKKSIAWTRNHL